MGDIVDWMFQSGMLDMPDPFDHDEGGYGYSKPLKITQCRYCHSTDVKWNQFNGKWRLFTKEQLHTCSSMPTLKD